jgi:hypothetical protein
LASVGVVAVFFPWINRGYNNLEYLFPMAARGLSDPANSELVDAYWGIQDNPLGYSFFLGLMYKIMGFHEWFWLARIPSVVGCFLIIASGYLLVRVNFWIFCFLLVLNPLIFVFSASATADILPVGLLMFAVALATGSHNSKLVSQILSAVFFGLSIVVKYNSIYFGLLFVFSFYLSTMDFKNGFKLFLLRLVLFVGLSGVIVLAYLWWSYERFGVFGPNNRELYSPDFYNIFGWVKTFGVYLSFLGLLGLVLPIAVVLSRDAFGPVNMKHFVVLTFVIAGGWLMSSPLTRGEMDFGKGTPFGPIVTRVVLTAGFLNGVLIFRILWHRIRSADRLAQLLMAGLLPYLILISASRPTQRYLTYAVPIVLILLVESLESVSKRFRLVAVGFTSIAFVSVAFLGISYLTAQGNAAERMASWIEKNNLISLTDPGAIFPHAGQHFSGSEDLRFRYEVVAVNSKVELEGQRLVLHRENMNYFGGFFRVYVLREILNEH